MRFACLCSMQQRMDLFGTALPKALRHDRANYGLQLYFIGQVMAGQAGRQSLSGDGSNPAVNPEEAKQAVGLVEMVYHGIHNLDINPKIRVPHEMLLALNPSQVFELYAGTWLLKLDADKWKEAVNRRDFWQVVGAARKAISEDPLRRSVLSKLDELCGKIYLADEAGNLPSRLRQLPQSVATEFMDAFTTPFRSSGSSASYIQASKLKKGFDVVVFGHFAGKFAEGERQLSIAKV